MKYQRRTALGSLALISLLTVVFAGCAVGPDYIKPDAPEPTQWIERDDPKIKAEPADLTQWWTVFKDPVLNKLVAMAYQQNLSLRAAGIRILEARAQLGIAKGNLYPQSQSFGAGYERGKASENLDIPVFQTYYDRYDMGFDAAWELDFWGKFRRAVESGFGNLDASIAQYDDFLVTLTAEVARTYVLIRTFEERLAIAWQNVEIQMRSLRIADVRFQGGEVTELDVAQAKALLGNTQALIPRLETGLRQSENALSILLGKLPGEVREILVEVRPIPTAPGNVAMGVPAELLRRRPDIRQAERQVASQSARIGVAKADLYPHFSLFGSIGLLSASTGSFFDSDSWRGGFGPTLRWDIFNYGRIKNRVRVEDARLQELIVIYQDTVLRAAQEAEDSVIAFLRSQEEEQFLSSSVDASERSVELSLIQYREGMVDYQRVLDTQRFLTDQQDQLTSTTGDVALNLISLYKALGGGWEMRVGKDFVPPETTKAMQQRTDWGNLLTPAHVTPPPEGERSQWHRPDW